MLTVEQAEAKLKKLEAPIHEYDLANIALRKAEQNIDDEGGKELLAKATTRYNTALTNLSTVDQEAIAQAAQDVLDARGEAHTEENTLHAKEAAQSKSEGASV